MDGGTDQAIYGVLAGLVTTLLVGYALWGLLGLLKRNRPDLALGLPLAVAFGIRAIVAALIATTGLERTLRGGR
jgi:hypothetical protein